MQVSQHSTPNSRRLVLATALVVLLLVLTFSAALAFGRIQTMQVSDGKWSALVSITALGLSIEDALNDSGPVDNIIRPDALSIPAPSAATRPQLFSSGPMRIGYSTQHRPLVAYRIGHGPSKRALIGGIHGGYEWNTVALMSDTLEYVIAHPEVIPDAVTLYILPVMNPDGLAAGTDRVHGRMNGNRVDLNRNWDYQWQMTATHGVWPVSGGTRAFSERESIAVRNFLLQHEFDAVVFYHSAMARVFPGAGVNTSHTVELAQRIAEATGYRYSPEGVVGQVTTGDAIDWATANGINAIEIELTTHHDIDWEQNLNGLIALLNWRLPRAPVERQPAYAWQ